MNRFIIATVLNALFVSPALAADDGWIAFDFGSDDIERIQFGSKQDGQFVAAETFIANSETGTLRPIDSGMNAASRDRRVLVRVTKRCFRAALPLVHGCSDAIASETFRVCDIAAVTRNLSAFLGIDLPTAVDFDGKSREIVTPTIDRGAHEQIRLSISPETVGRSRPALPGLGEQLAASKSNNQSEQQFLIDRARISEARRNDIAERSQAIEHEHFASKERQRDDDRHRLEWEAKSRIQRNAESLAASIAQLRISMEQDEQQVMQERALARLPRRQSQDDELQELGRPRQSADATEQHPSQQDDGSSPENENGVSSEQAQDEEEAKSYYARTEPPEGLGFGIERLQLSPHSTTWDPVSNASNNGLAEPDMTVADDSSRTTNSGESNKRYRIATISVDDQFLADDDPNDPFDLNHALAVRALKAEFPSVWASDISRQLRVLRDTHGHRFIRSDESMLAQLGEIPEQDGQTTVRYAIAEPVFRQMRMHVKHLEQLQGEFSSAGVFPTRASDVIRSGAELAWRAIDYAIVGGYQETKKQVRHGLATFAEGVASSLELLDRPVSWVEGKLCGRGDTGCIRNTPNPLGTGMHSSKGVAQVLRRMARKLRLTVRSTQTFANAPRGARGPISGRSFDVFQAGGPVRHLTTDRIKITDRGINYLEHHISRFGNDAANSAMVNRLRRISRGELKPTQHDLNFYSHELRESVRYRRLGRRTGAGDEYDLWNNAHTGTLEDYRLPEFDANGNRTLYHPDTWYLFE